MISFAVAVPSRRPGVLDASRRRMHFYRRAASNRLIPHSIEVRMKPGQFFSAVLLALIAACSTSWAQNVKIKPLGRRRAARRVSFP